MAIDYPEENQVRQLRELWKIAFGDTEEFLDAFFGAAYAPQRCRCVAENGNIVAVLYWFDVSCGEDRLAYLYAVATHPDYRGRGLCRMLMADTHAQLAARGYAGALLVPQKEGLRNMYASFGYRDCGSVAEFSAAAGDETVSLRKIPQAEYARLRRQYLPDGGVVQEGENLDFLGTYASFYAGEDFLLAAATEKDNLFAMELLGNADAAPGILRTLGCKDGTFRTTGNTRPFAMYFPLAEQGKLPGYFGLAFD